MRLFISFSALFLSVALLQLSNGGVGPLDALSGIALGFTTEQIGLLGSAHFFGFFIGCWWAPRLMGDVGHSRAFAVFTAVGAIGLLAHFLVIDPLAWAVMRVAAGFCIAGSYTVIEAWLQAKLTNEIRGRAMGTYRLVDMGASLAAQMVISVLEPASYVSYNLLALICCAAIIPLTLTRSAQPQMPAAPRLRPALAYRSSPLAVAGVIVAGITSASFRMVGPIYGQEIGLSQTQIGWFLASFVAGGAIAQLPMGYLADKFDRRWVLIWISALSIFACVAVATLGGPPQTTLFLGALTGFITFPVFSIASAHANDFASDDQWVELAASLMFYYAVGAIGAPYLASTLIAGYGPSTLFILISAGHAFLVVFGILRMRVRPTEDERTRYIWLPRTSFTIGRLTGRSQRRREGHE